MNIHDYAESKRLSLKQVMDFTSTANPLGPSNKAKNAIRKEIKYLQFPVDQMSRRLRRYIARREGVKETEILFACGSTPILRGLLHTTAFKSLFFPSPVSKRFQSLAAEFNSAIVQSPLPTGDNPSDSMRTFSALFTESDTIIIPNPHDLTGTVMGEEVLLVLIHMAERAGKPVIIDESYRDFVPTPSPLRTIVDSGNAAIVRTFSLFHALAGLPTGYAIGSERILEKIRKACFITPANPLGCVAALASMKDKGYKKRTMDFISGEKTFLKERLGKIPAVEVHDTPCNYLLLKIASPSAEITKTLLRAKGILIDGFTDGEGNTFLRLPVKTRKENGRFAKALKPIFQS